MSDFAKEFQNYIHSGEGPQRRARDEKLSLGRERFGAFCRLIAPEFYRPERRYQELLCDTFQRFCAGELATEGGGAAKDILIVNIPPGFGKSYTAALLAAWVLGREPQRKIIVVSYNQLLSSKFSKAARGLILDRDIPGDRDFFCVNSFFPRLKIKAGDGAVERWSVAGSHDSYLATGFEGSITGMRGDLGIIDDPIKNAVEAVSEHVKDRHWDFYKNTFSSRILDGGKQIIIQTRWATDDLAGRLIREFPARCHVLELKAITEAGESLCEGLYSLKNLEQKRNTLDPEIWSANYMQEPLDIQGALYGQFKTYGPEDFDPDTAERLIAYTDTADQGADYLCCVMGAVRGRYGYVTEVYYTEAAMEVTEPETARRLALNGIREAVIESNNGGRGFSRNVMNHLKALGAKKCVVTWFHQSKNKTARILVNAANAMEQVLMPAGWERRWPEFYKALAGYQRKGRNKHDDGADALTGFVEMINKDVKGVGRVTLFDKRKLGRWV